MYIYERIKRLKLLLMYDALFIGIDRTCQYEFYGPVCESRFIRLMSIRCVRLKGWALRAYKLSF